MRIGFAQRLTALIALSVLAISVLGLGVQYQMIKRDLDIRQRQLVQDDLAAFSTLYEQSRIVAVRQAIVYHGLLRPGGSMLLALHDRSGAVLAGSEGNWVMKVPMPPEGQTSGPVLFSVGSVRYVGIARTLPGGFPLWVARSTRPAEETLAQLRRVIFAVIAAVVLASLAIGHYASRRIMRKVARINRLADRVAGGELSARLGGARAPDEFGLLEKHIHNMLDRIEALNRASGHLSDTIAHEMRTPLTRIQTRLARLDLDGSDAEAVLREIRDTVRIFDSLLEIARAQGAVGDRPGLVPLDLSALVCEVFELYEALAEDRGVTFTADIEPGVTVLGDRNLAAMLVSNLFENALKFTPGGESVTVTLHAGQPRHDLTVADTGPGLPPGFEDRMFERFARAPRDLDIEGHGLGLALVQAIALRHGARISLPPVDRGFSIRIAWPAAPNDL
ncbi:MAG: sensor histidine kinase [Jhaorihella sp.]